MDYNKIKVCQNEQQLTVTKTSQINVVLKGNPVNQGWAISYTWKLNGPVLERPWARNVCGSKAVKHTHTHIHMCVQMHMHAQNKQCTCLALPFAANLSF